MKFPRKKEPARGVVGPNFLPSRGQPVLVFAVTLLLPVAFLWGCSGIVSGQSTQSVPPPPTYGISGTITPAAGGNGATITLSGAANATTTANSSGNFTFSGLANGTYAITPSHAGFTFSPSSATVTINGANVTSGANFTATANPTFSVSGTLSPTTGGSGATVTLSGAAAATTTADGVGTYAFSGLANGTYTVAPSNAGYTFSPTVQAVTVNGANVTGINFIATATATYSISGTISPTTGGSGATVTLSGAAAATTTANSSGNYTFTGLSNATYTVTPGNTGFTFTPASQNVTINAANVTGVNFTATAQVVHSVALTWVASTSVVAGYNVYRSTVSGSSYLKINSSLIPGVSYTDADAQSATIYYYVVTAVDGSGNESSLSNETSATIP